MEIILLYVSMLVIMATSFKAHNMRKHKIN